MSCYKENPFKIQRSSITVANKLISKSKRILSRKDNLNAYFENIVSTLAVDYSNQEIQDIEGAVKEMMDRLKNRINERGLFNISRFQPCGSMVEKTAVWKRTAFAKEEIKNYIEFDFLAVLGMPISRGSVQPCHGCMSLGDVYFAHDHDICECLFATKLSRSFPETVSERFRGELESIILAKDKEQLIYKPLYVEHKSALAISCSDLKSTGLLKIETSLESSKLSMDPNDFRFLCRWTSKAMSDLKPVHFSLLKHTSQYRPLPVYINYLPALEIKRTLGIKLTGPPEHDRFVVSERCTSCKNPSSWRMSYCMDEIDYIVNGMSVKHRECLKLLKYFTQKFKLIKSYQIKAVVLNHSLICSDSSEDCANCMTSILSELKHAYVNGILLAFKRPANLLGGIEAEERERCIHQLRSAQNLLTRSLSKNAIYGSCQTVTSDSRIKPCAKRKSLKIGAKPSQSLNHDYPPPPFQCAGTDVPLLSAVHKGDTDLVSSILDSGEPISKVVVKKAIDHSLEAKDRKIASDLLHYACKLMTDEDEANIYEAWPAYEEQDEWRPVFVVLLYANSQGEWTDYLEFRVFKRRFDFVSQEAALVISSQQFQDNLFEFEYVNQLDERLNSAELMKIHKNITLINTCPCRSKRGGQDIAKEKCVVIHCLLKGKIPWEEKPFPKMVSKLPVDVRECYVIYGMKPEADSHKEEQTVGTTDCQSETNGVTRNSKSDDETQSNEKDSVNGFSEHSSVRPPTSASSGNNVSILQNDGVKSEESDMEIDEDDCYHLQHQGDDLRALFQRLDLLKYLPTFETQEVDLKAFILLDEQELENNFGIKLIGPRKKMMAAIETIRNNDYASSNMALDTQTMIGHGLPIGRSPSDFNATLRMGAEISVAEDKSSTGTLGGFVHLSDGGSGFITCAHVVMQKNDVAVSQPSYEHIPYEKRSSSVVCGMVEKVVFNQEVMPSDVSVDAAVVRITHRHPKNAEFVQISSERLESLGFDPKVPLNFSSGKVLTGQELNESRDSPIIQIGSQRGLTKGNLAHNGSSVKFAHHNMKMSDGKRQHLMHNQMEVTAVAESPIFFDLGDSGSLVFVVSTDNELRCIGLAIGRTSHYTCIVTPIDHVLKKLELNPQFVDFTART